VSDTCTAAPLPSGRTPDDKWPPDRQVACYWPFHKPLMDVGVDGWWPDQGDGLDGPSELNRHRMYWEGSQRERPTLRPFALHRNASAGIQRYGGYIWSGDVQSRWETLKQHVPVGINSGLSGFPLWGTDIGGFYGTADYTGELFVRWFQFAAFNPLFRSHGRNWHLHLPWGWDGGDGGPQETANFTPDPAELHNAQVEPICRKYLRAALSPHAVHLSMLRDTQETGMPMMPRCGCIIPTTRRRSRAAMSICGARSVGRPVFEKGATTRRLYFAEVRVVRFLDERARGRRHGSGARRRSRHCADLRPRGRGDSDRTGEAVRRRAE
jgi:alpha-glucosidase/alpha-D-xyloside xylohydrolase